MTLADKIGELSTMLGLQGRPFPAKRKYFEHAGALMTADGTGDELIKLEGGPKGEKFTL